MCGRTDGAEMSTKTRWKKPTRFGAGLPPDSKEKQRGAEGDLQGSKKGRKILETTSRGQKKQPPTPPIRKTRYGVERTKAPTRGRSRPNRLAGGKNQLLWDHRKLSRKHGRLLKRQPRDGPSLQVRGIAKFQISKHRPAEELRG